MNSLPERPFTEHRVDRISMPPANAETERLVGEYKSRQVKTCPSPSSIHFSFLRGLPGSGKTSHADSLKDVKVVGAGLIAAMREAKGGEVTEQNKRELIKQYYQDNSANVTFSGQNKDNRQMVLDSLHAEAKKQIETLIESSSSDHQTNIVVDNTNIAPWEAASYFAIAMQYGIPLENIEIIDINPFNNPKFRNGLQQQMAKERMLLDCSPESWPQLTFKSTARGGSNETIDMSHPVARTMVCNALNSVRIEGDSMTVSYLRKRLDKFLNYGLSVTDLIQSAINEPVKSDNPLPARRAAGQPDRQGDPSHRPLTGADSQNWRRAERPPNAPVHGRPHNNPRREPSAARQFTAESEPRRDSDRTERGRTGRGRQTTNRGYPSNRDNTSNRDQQGFWPHTRPSGNSKTDRQWR
ncbi:hypothetical protein [Endozoicomonas lisbonensis]|uniref:UDP-N-acetylglucosamine kinase n=1 Tax=Endozoicomonas lisbonensis TaxID=3120522 RepID=A0ABV2SKV4_9GAMM